MLTLLIFIFAIATLTLTIINCININKLLIPPCGSQVFDPKSKYLYILDTTTLGPISGILDGIIHGKRVYELSISFKPDKTFDISIYWYDKPDESSASITHYGTDDFPGNIWDYNPKTCMITVAQINKRLDVDNLQKVANYVTISNEIYLNNNGQLILYANLLGFIPIQFAVNKVTSGQTTTTMSPTTLTTMAPTTTQTSSPIRRNMFRM
jgi:hypothetical protein